MLTMGHYAAEMESEGRIRIIPAETHATFVFQPGDGTRYVCTVTKLIDAECAVHGCAPGSYMVSIMTGSNQFKSLCLMGVPHYFYLQEKLEMREYNAKAWERLLGFVFEAQNIGPFPWEG